MGWENKQQQQHFDIMACLKIPPWYRGYWWVLMGIVYPMFSKNHITKIVNFTNQRWAWKHGTRRAGQYSIGIRTERTWKKRAAKAKQNLAIFSANKKRIWTKKKDLGGDQHGDIMKTAPILSRINTSEMVLKRCLLAGPNPHRCTVRFPCVFNTTIMVSVEYSIFLGWQTS